MTFASRWQPFGRAGAFEDPLCYRAEAETLAVLLALRLLIKAAPPEAMRK
jgi:hypothetical protein